MIRCYAYTRVSTVKQGERGVSLQEQGAAIENYAQRHGIQIAEWFEERLTAAKQGRPLFTKMLKNLRNGEAQGVVIHKIDRSARNLRDWAALGDLIDIGVQVYFANESVDLQSRGGRLSADIQAVVAADYIRNLREETLKGIRGRLKQGIYPFASPLGYLDAGGGKPKTVDPDRGHFVTQAFELYATGRYTLNTLCTELHKRGLRNRRDGPVTICRLSEMLNNPFYAGLIRLTTINETFAGKHEALIPMSLFRTVQARLAGRVRVDSWTHDFTFRGLFRCSLCNRMLTGERQKGHVYYRCHTRTCPTRGFREEVLEAALLRTWPPIAVTDLELKRLRNLLDYIQSRDEHDDTPRLNQIQMKLGAVKARMTRLVDALVDGNLDKQIFEDRKRELLEEQRVLEDALRPPEQAKKPDPTQTVIDMFELVLSAQRSYELGNLAARRELVIRLSSNRTVAGKKVVVEPHPALRVLANRGISSQSGHYRNAARTLSTARIAWKLYRWAQRWLAREPSDRRLH